MEREVQIPDGVSPDVADVGGADLREEFVDSTRRLLAAVDLLGGGAVGESSRGATALDGGATRPTKIAAVAGAVLVAAIWACVAFWWSGEETANQVAAIGAAALVTAFTVAALGYLMATDIRSRTTAATATVEARERIALAMIEAAATAKLAEDEARAAEAGATLAQAEAERTAAAARLVEAEAGKTAAAVELTRAEAERAAAAARWAEAEEKAAVTRMGEAEAQAAAERAAQAARAAGVAAAAEAAETERSATVTEPVAGAAAVESSVRGRAPREAVVAADPAPPRELVALPKKVEVKYLSRRKKDKKGWKAIAIERRGEDELRYLIVRGKEKALVDADEVSFV